MARTVTTPTDFKKPDYYNTDLINQVSGMVNTTKNKTSQNKSKAQAGTENVADKAKSTSGESLFSDQNANIAQTGGKQGMINDKDYSTTLRLARAADAYNSMPVGQIFKNGTRNTGGTQSLGYGFDKPQLNTTEQQVRDQSMALDTQRKQAEIQLQSAIDAKDYDTFKSLIQQWFNIELNDLQVRNALDELGLQTTMQDVLAKNMEEFRKEYGRYFDADTARVIYNMVQSNEPWAMQLANVLDGQAVPASKQDQFAADFVDGYLRESNPQTSEEAITAYNGAIKWLQQKGIQFDVQAQAMAQAAGGTFAKWAAKIRELSNLDDYIEDPYKTTKSKETK